jgi:hypothetical protein
MYLINRTLSQKQNSTAKVLENTNGGRKTCIEFNTQVKKNVQTATQFRLLTLAEQSLKGIGNERQANFFKDIFENVF